MRNIPQWINSKEDVYNLIELVNQNQLNKSDVKQKLIDLISDRFVFTYLKDVDEDYEPKENERKRPDIDSSTSPPTFLAWRLDILTENTTARFIQMGFTYSELETIINDLED